MPFCRECGGQVEVTWKFCPHCNNEQESSVVIGNDSVHVGDITVNKIDEIKQGLEEVLAGLGFTKDSSPTELTPSQEAEVEQVLEMSEQLASHGLEIDPWTEIVLGNAAKLSGRTNTAQQHYLRALETFRKSGDRQGEAASLGNLGLIAQTRGDLAEAERLQRDSLAIKREIGDRQGEAASLGNLGNIAETRGDLAEAERLQRESLAIKREIGDRQGEADSLINLGIIASKNGNMDERHRCYTEAVRIQREIGIPIDQWFIDNGY
jgi:tetratricopeptide (TPR) repeat protein